MSQVSNGIYGKLIVIRANGDDANFFPLNELENTLGRDPECLVHLRSWDISRVHAKIVFDADTRQATIIDTSVNGTLLNSEPLTEPTILKNDDVIQMGQRSFRFQKSDPISASKMVSIKQKLKNSPGYFKKIAKSIVDLPPTPKKAKSSSMSIKKMLFKDLISAKYADKDLNVPSESRNSDMIQQQSATSSPIQSARESTVGSPVKNQSVGKAESECSSIHSSNRNRFNSPLTDRKVGPAQRIKITPNSAPRSMIGQLNAMKKSLSVANTPKGSMDFLKQLKDAKKIVKNSPKVAATTPKYHGSAQKSTSGLSSKSGSVKKSPSACQSVARLAQSAAREASILDASKDVFFEQVKGFVGFSKAPASEAKTNARFSPELESNARKKEDEVRRRSVTFGPPLEPEVFDKRNAPSSPLTRGEPAPQLSSKDGTPTHKSILKVASEEKMSIKSRKSARNSMALNSEVHRSSPLSTNTLFSPLGKDYSSEAYLTKSTAIGYEAISDGDVHDGLDEEAQEHDTANIMVADQKDDTASVLVVDHPATNQQVVKDSNVNYSGMKQLLKTPIAFHQKEADLSGVSSLFQSPKIASQNVKSPAVEKAAESPNIEYKGVRKLLKTPKPDPSVSYLGMKEMLKTPHHPAVVSLVGVKELVQTPKDGDVISLLGLKELVKTPKPAHTVSLEGLKELMLTPVTSNVDFKQIETKKSEVKAVLEQVDTRKDEDNADFDLKQMDTHDEGKPLSKSKTRKSEVKAVLEQVDTWKDEDNADLKQMDTHHEERPQSKHKTKKSEVKAVLEQEKEAEDAKNESVPELKHVATRMTRCRLKALEKDHETVDALEKDEKVEKAKPSKIPKDLSIPAASFYGSSRSKNTVMETIVIADEKEEPVKKKRKESKIPCATSKKVDDCDENHAQVSPVKKRSTRGRPKSHVLQESNESPEKEIPSKNVKKPSVHKEKSIVENEHDIVKKPSVEKGKTIVENEDAVEKSRKRKSPEKSVRRSLRHR